MEQNGTERCGICGVGWIWETASWECDIKVCLSCLLRIIMHLCREFPNAKSGECVYCGKSLENEIYPNWVKTSIICIDCVNAVKNYGNQYVTPNKKHMVD